MADLSTFVEVSLKEQDDFLKVKETLTRIGVSSRKEKILYQSCHILHKRGQYYIVHFKELFFLDGKPANITENDIERRNAIAKLLEEWELVKVMNPQIMEGKIAPIHQIKIISFKEKEAGLAQVLHFEPEVDECGTGRRPEPLLYRYCRKKFKCLIILLLAIISVSQTIALIVEHVDLNRLAIPFENLASNTVKTNMSKLIEKLIDDEMTANIVKNLDFDATKNTNNITEITNILTAIANYLKP